LRLEQSLVEKRERECVKHFDSNLLINAEEANLLQRETGHSSIQTVKPLLTDIGRVVDRRYNGDPVFVFLGALSVPHNQFSIIYFIETQMDKIIDKIPGVRLRVIGRGESRELLRLAQKYKGIVSIEGFLDDLNTVFSESCAMIIPLLYGSGVKIKTLEALARALPVISTDFGVEGIPVTNSVNCIVENDINQYPQLMRAVVDIDYNLDISRKAHSFYLENYSEERVFQEYELLFGEQPKSGMKGPTSN
jgi:glycosyltransferase involved in cell wall biosynthesis